MKPGELASRLFWRLGPILLIVWAVRSGVIDYQTYIRIIKGETKTPVELQLDKVSELLIDNYRNESRIPDEYQLAFWLTQHPRAREVAPRPNLDPFGNSIRMKKIPDGFVLTSDGPDRKASTPDDVTKKVEGLAKLALQ